MKIVGHTMGTPEATVIEAIDLFAHLGLDGIEIICSDDYPCGLNLGHINDRTRGNPAARFRCRADNRWSRALYQGHESP